MNKSDIEENPADFDVFENPNLVAKAAQEFIALEIEKSKALALPVTYREGFDIVREFPDGRKETIDSIPEEER